ncbi:hypothetical protein NR798_34405 [Archangium gephyra]|uniref:hypothetical protein n=1 Tax=Archangium gephyra TaxID=48 RepID=UPI0035D4088A
MGFMSAPREPPGPLSPSRQAHGGRFGFRFLALLPLGAASVLLMLLFLREREPVAAHSPDNPVADTAPALLLRACQALEDARLDEAEEAISRLRTTAPDRPEPLLLRNLLEQRRKLLAPGWGQAFLQAWNEVGRPDLRDSSLLPPAFRPKADASSLLSQVWPRASAEALPTLAMAMPSLSEEQARGLLRHLSSLEDTAALVALLDPRRSSLFPEVLHSEAEATLIQRLRWLSRDASRAMLPRLTLLLSGTRGEESFNAQELKTLEAISTLPSWRETSFSQTFLQARGLLRDSALPDAATRAFGVAEQTVGAGVALLLQRRAEASWSHLSAEEQRWLGRMLWHIGQRMAEATSLLEHSVGTLLMELGAEHMGQMCDLEQARRRDDMVREGLRASLAASIERWPLPSLLEDLESSRARHELTWLRAFTGHAELP